MSPGSQCCSAAAKLQSGSQPHGAGPCQLPACCTAGSKPLLHIETQKRLQHAVLCLQKAPWKANARRFPGGR